MRKMKRTAMMLSVLTALTCCGRSIEPERVKEQPVRMVETTFLVGSLVSRAETEAGAESAVSTLDILVFRQSDGSLINSGRSADNSVVLSIPEGRHDCYAVVNSHADLSLVTKKSQLLDKVSYLKDCTEGFEMIGYTAHTFYDATTTVSFDVRRFAVKVALNSVSVRFKSSLHSSQTFTLRRMFLENVNPSCPYTYVSTAASASAWLNRMGYLYDADTDALTSESMNVVIADGSTYNTAHYFYCYPNPTADDAQGVTPFSPRFTRLVVEATIGDRTCYYPISLPQPAANRCYNIAGLTVTGAGSDNPDRDPETKNMTFGVSITEWNDPWERGKEIEF